MNQKLLFPLLVFLQISACSSSQISTPQVVVIEVTSTPVPITATPVPTDTPIPSPTATATNTPEPTNTPTATLEPAFATQTQVAAIREATREFNQHIDDIRSECTPIDWQELSEVQYAKDHERDCVYIRVVVSNINFEEELLDVWIGWYSAQIVVGLNNIDYQSGRITDDMWLNVYGRVNTKSWVWINNLSGDETPVTGVQARLIEGPNGLLWVDE